MRSRPINSTMNFIEIRHVHLQRKNPPAQRLDLVGQTGMRVYIPESKRQIGPRIRKGKCYRSSKASSRTGDERDLPVECKIRKFSHQR